MIEGILQVDALKDPVEMSDFSYRPTGIKSVVRVPLMRVMTGSRNGANSGSSNKSIMRASARQLEAFFSNQAIAACVTQGDRGESARDTVQLSTPDRAAVGELLKCMTVLT